MKLLRFGIVLLLIAGVACGGDTRVGSGVDVENLDEDAASLRDFLDESEPGGSEGGFVAGAAEQERPQEAASTDTAAQDRQREMEQYQEEVRERAAVEFSITQAGFEPHYITVYEGGVVKVVNRDSEARSVTSDTGEFDSGDLPPGKEWFYEATAVGQFNFHDATRPYVVGTLEVLPR